MIKIQTILQRIQLFLGSKLFFGIVLGVFTLSSLWIAVASIYPMAFDEEVHFGTIQLYAESFNPFAIQQTAAANDFGTVTTDPSYLYHYLMSFPYRLLSALTTNQDAIIITLRLLNVAIVACAIVLYRRLFLRMKLSPALVHTVLAIFVLIPVVPLLAAHINYDNLLILVVVLSLLLVQQIHSAFQKTTVLPLGTICWLLGLLLLGSVVKYAFLPVALALGIYVLWMLWRKYRSFSALGGAVQHAFTQFSSRTKLALLVFLVIGAVYFGGRYGANMVTYHTPVPDCEVVLSLDQCMQWGPWARNYNYQNDLVGYEARNPVLYTFRDWLPGMWQRLFFTLAGPTNGYATRAPLPLPSFTFIVVALVGIVLFVRYFRVLIRKHPLFVVFVAVTGVYVAALWFQVYSDHLLTHRPVAINGRYLVPFLPLIGVMMVAAYKQYLDTKQWAAAKPVLATIVIVLFLQGGGAATYILRSEPNWLWQNAVIQNTDKTLKAIARPLIFAPKNYFWY